MPRDALPSASSHRHISPLPASPRSRVARKTERSENDPRRTWRARARARGRDGCGLRGRVAPKERDRPPPLPPRPPVCSCSGSDRADTDPTRRRRSEEERRRVAKRTGRGRRSARRNGAAEKRGRNGIEVEREETINNTGGKTEKRATRGKWEISGGSTTLRTTAHDSLGSIFTFVATFSPRRGSRARAAFKNRESREAERRERQALLPLMRALGSSTILRV